MRPAIPVYDSGDVVRQLERADHIANSDSWPGDRTARVADVNTATLRAVAIAGAAIAAALEQLATQLGAVPADRQPKPWR